jgi:diamine N-acetyltransferase
VTPSRVTLRRLDGSPADRAALQAVVDAAPIYSLRLSGQLPSPTAAEAICTALPPAKSLRDKYVFGVHLDQAMVGCVDLIRGYPQADIAFIGLLLLDESHRRVGIGRAAFQCIERVVRDWPECRRIRLSIVRANDDVMPFWSSLGFIAIGETGLHRHGGIVSEKIVMERPLPAEIR